MKVPEKVLVAFYRDRRASAEQTRALEAALEQLREELEGDEAVKAGSAAAFVEVSALLESDIRSAVTAALNSVLGDKEKGR